MNPTTAVAFLMLALMIAASLATVVEMHAGGGDK